MKNNNRFKQCLAAMLSLGTLLTLTGCERRDHGSSIPSYSKENSVETSSISESKSDSTTPHEHVDSIMQDGAAYSSSLFDRPVSSTDKWNLVEEYLGTDPSMQPLVVEEDGVLQVATHDNTWATVRNADSSVETELDPYSDAKFAMYEDGDKLISSVSLSTGSMGLVMSDGAVNPAELLISPSIRIEMNDGLVLETRNNNQMTIKLVAGSAVMYEQEGTRDLTGMTLITIDLDKPDGVAVSDLQMSDLNMEESLFVRDAATHFASLPSLDWDGLTEHLKSFS